MLSNTAMTIQRLTPPKGKRILGLDIGEKTIGIALSDRLHSIATPQHTISRTKWQADLDQLRQFSEENEIGMTVLGLPLNMDGTEGPRVQSVRQFARNLQKDGFFAPMPLVFWDERLSTQAVERSMIESDLSRARRAEIIDSAAAAYILQGYLDSLRQPTD